MPWHTGLQIHYVIADPKVREKDINRKYLKWNIFQVTTDLLNYYYTAMPWATRLQFYYVIANSKVGE